jgi:hypothetical protein
MSVTCSTQYNDACLDPAFKKLNQSGKVDHLVSLYGHDVLPMTYTISLPDDKSRKNGYNANITQALGDQISNITVKLFAYMGSHMTPVLQVAFADNIAFTMDLPRNQTFNNANINFVQPIPVTPMHVSIDHLDGCKANVMATFTRVEPNAPQIDNFVLAGKKWTVKNGKARPT